MPSFVYVLGCRAKDRTLTYVGWTTDVDRRLAQHNAGSGALDARAGLGAAAHRTLPHAPPGHEPGVASQAGQEVSEGAGTGNLNPEGARVE